MHICQEKNTHTHTTKKNLWFQQMKFHSPVYTCRQADRQTQTFTDHQTYSCAIEIEDLKLMMSRSKGTRRIVKKNQSVLQALFAKGKLTPKTHMHIQIAGSVIELQNLCVCVCVWEREREKRIAEGLTEDRAGWSLACLHKTQEKNTTTSRIFPVSNQSSDTAFSDHTCNDLDAIFSCIIP